MVDVSRRRAGDLAQILTSVTGVDQADQEGGAGGGGEEGDPGVSHHHQVSGGDVVAGVVDDPPPGEHHGTQPVNTALQPASISDQMSIILMILNIGSLILSSPQNEILSAISCSKFL